MSLSLFSVLACAVLVGLSYKIANKCSIPQRLKPPVYTKLYKILPITQRLIVKVFKWLLTYLCVYILALICTIFAIF